MGQLGDLGMPKDCDAVFTHNSPPHLRNMLIGPFGMFQSLPGTLLPGLVILLLIGFRSTAMSVSGPVVQLGSSLVILEM